MYCADYPGSLNVGCAVRFKRANSKASISVIVPGADGLVRRTCLRSLRWDLLTVVQKG